MSGPNVARGAAAFVACLWLGACGPGGFLGETASSPPLPGERISVLDFNRGIEADSSIADEPVVLPPAYPNADWSQPGGDPDHAMYHLSLPSPLEIAWRVDIGVGSDHEVFLLTQPIVVDNVVYAMDALSLVSAYDADSGARLWATDLEDEDEDDGYFGGGLAYGDGRLFVTTGFAKVFALDPRTGERLWERRAPGPMRSGPAYADGRLYILTVDNQLMALDGVDGGLLWNHVGVEETAGLLGLSTVAIADNVVVVPYTSGELLGIQADSGRVVWQESLAALTVLDPLSDIPQIKGLPVIDNEQVFAISHAGRMVGLDLQQGIRLWDIDLGGVETPWLAGAYLFVITSESQLVSVRRRDGRIRWVRALERYKDPEEQEDLIRWQGPVLAGGQLIAVNSLGQLVFFSPENGETLSTLKLPSSAAVSPTVANNSLFIVTPGADLIALR